MLTLYGVPLSPFVRKVRLLLEEKGIQYHLEPVGPRSAPPEFRQISPLGKVPALRDGDITLADSSVICAYIESKYPAKTLLPQNSYDYARVLWFEEYADSALASSAVFKVFFEVLVKPRFLKQTTDMNLVSQAVNAELPIYFDYFEQELKDGKVFLVANSYTLADISVAAIMANFYYAGYEVDAKKWPYFNSYLSHQFDLPILNRFMMEERAILAKYST